MKQGPCHPGKLWCCGESIRLHVTCNASLHSRKEGLRHGLPSGRCKRKLRMSMIRTTGSFNSGKETEEHRVSIKLRFERCDQIRVPDPYDCSRNFCTRFKTSITFLLREEEFKRILTWQPRLDQICILCSSVLQLSMALNLLPCQIYQVFRAVLT